MSARSTHFLADGRAGAFRAGALSTPLGPTGGRTVQLFRLGARSDAFALEPSPVLVSIRYQTTTAAWSGRAEVVGTAFFASGNVQQRIDFDVPAGGTVIALAAGDGLDVDVVALGDSADFVADLAGTVAYLTGSHPRAAQRTLRWSLAAETTLVRRLPTWSRAMRATSSVSPFPATLIELTRSPIVGVGDDTIASFTGAENTVHPVPAASDSVRVTSAAAHQVNLVFELAP